MIWQLRDGIFLVPMRYLCILLRDSLRLFATDATSFPARTGSRKESICTQTGWEYVASVGSSLHIFRAPAASAVPKFILILLKWRLHSICFSARTYMLGLSALAMFALCLIPLFIYGNVPLGLLVYADYLFILSLVPAISLMIIAGNGIAG